MSQITDKARRLRSTIEILAENLDDEAAIDAVELFPNWAVGTKYEKDERVRYNGALYKVLHPHTSQEDWAPDTASSLFARVLIPDPEVIPVWEQPDSTNPYMKGDKVHYPTADDDIYESTVDNNVWSPVDYPDGWKIVEG